MASGDRMTTVERLRRTLVLMTVLAVTLLLLAPPAVASMQRSKGQTIYLSVIPQSESGHRKRLNYLAFFMTVRNTDLNHAVKIRSITYHNASGKIQKTILSKAMTLEPLASHAMTFEKKELAIPEGMSGCMIIQWDAAEKVSPVLVDGVVVGSGTGWSAGMVFQGVVVEEK